MTRPLTAQEATPSTVLAARSMVVIGILSGVATWGTSFLPYPDGFDRTGVRQIGLLTIGLALVLLLLPWRRWPHRSTLVLVPVALALIAAHNTVSSGDAYRYGTFFLVLFMWIGIWHRPWTCLAVAPAAGVAYVVPLVLTHVATYAAWTVLYALPVFVVVGEILARRSWALATALRELQQIAVTDHLTGLPDRSVFELAVAGAVGTGAQVLYLDVDEFKSVNDRFGHAAGDEVLRAVGCALRASVRADDLVARVAGDEFGAVLHSPVTRSDAERVLERVAAALRSSGPDGTEVVVSGGVASADGVSHRAVIAAADEAMYRVKAAARRP